MCEKINITEIKEIDETYLKIDRLLQENKEIEKPTFDEKECCVLNTKNIIKILQLFGNKRILVRYGIAFFRSNSYWKVNLCNTEKLPDYLKKNRKSLHRLVYTVYYGYPKGITSKDFEIHHMCRNPECLNPLHLIAIPKDKHKEVEYLNQKLLKEGKTFQEIRFIIRKKLNKGEI